MEETKHILIAEDEAPLASALSLKLGNAGFKTTVARTGTEAIELMQKGSFDLMLLDLVMPGLNGYGVLEDMKRRNVGVPPIIILSNLAQEVDIEKATALGIKKYLVKSATPLKEVVEEVKRQLVTQ